MTDQPSTGYDLALEGASLSVYAVERDSGDEVAAVTPERALPPASNTKLVTAALALEHLGPDFRCETRAVGTNPVDDETLDGNLVLVGTGAPDHTVTKLDELAASVSQRVDRITGELLVDGASFTGGQLGPGWTVGDQRYYYGARSSAVALEQNQVTVTVVPSAEDDRQSVSVTPETAAVQTDVDVTVESDAADDDLRVFTDTESGKVTVQGAIPPGAEPVEEPVPVIRPKYHCGLAFAAALADAGVRLEGGVSVLDEDDERKDDDFPVLATLSSAPVRELIRQMNVPSDNFIAEQLARTIAREEVGEGSWDSWETLVTQHFDALGVETVRVRDGSGLSRYNLLPAEGVISHLQWADERPWSGEFFDSLPTPGEGTLSSRLEGISVAAKTGTITGTSALSGLVRRESAPDILFSVLHGGLTGQESDAANERQDAFVRWLDNGA